MMTAFFVGSRNIPSALKYMKRKGRAGPASYMASNPSLVQSWNTRLSSALLVRKGVTETALPVVRTNCCGQFELGNEGAARDIPDTRVGVSKLSLHVVRIITIVAKDDNLQLR